MSVMDLYNDFIWIRPAQIRRQFILLPKRGGGGGGMEFEPMLAPREKSPLPENFSPEKYWTHDAVHI